MARCALEFHPKELAGADEFGDSDRWLAVLAPNAAAGGVYSMTATGQELAKTSEKLKDRLLSLVCCFVPVPLLLTVLSSVQSLNRFCG